MFCTHARRAWNLQLIRQRSMRFLCPGCYLCTFQSLSRCEQLSIQHTPQNHVYAVWNTCLLPPSLPATSAVCFLCQNCSFFDQFTPLAPLELRKTFQTLWFRDLASRGAIRKASMPETASPRFHQLVLPMPLGLQFCVALQHVGDGSHHIGSAVEDGHQINLIQTLKPCDNILIRNHPKIREIWGDIDRRCGFSAIGLFVAHRCAIRLWPVQFWPIRFWPSCFARQFWPVRFWSKLVFSVLAVLGQ